MSSLTSLARQSWAGLRLILVLTVLLGILYPLAVWAVSRLPGLENKAEGSMITANGHVVGSALIGVDAVPANPAADPYFHARPSASAKGALGPGDPSTSGASNQAGDSSALVKMIQERRMLIAARDGVSPSAVPTDAVTASGSGLDPDISPTYAALQVNRVARVTGLPVDRVRQLVAANTHGRSLGVLGAPGVNITRLNLAIANARG
jgi:K+-transporting ATPase ATPase C chain